MAHRRTTSSLTLEQELERFLLDLLYNHLVSYLFHPEAVPAPLPSKCKWFPIFMPMNIQAIHSEVLLNNLVACLHSYEDCVIPPIATRQGSRCNTQETGYLSPVAGRRHNDEESGRCILPHNSALRSRRRVDLSFELLHLHLSNIHTERIPLSTVPLFASLLRSN
jgi:hypothetical protein